MKDIHSISNRFPEHFFFFTNVRNQLSWFGSDTRSSTVSYDIYIYLRTNVIN